MTKVLLTGGEGFLGTYIRKALEESGCKVDTLGRRPQNTLVADISEAVPVIDETYDLVVHAAGKAHMVPSSETESKLFFKVNLEGTRHICEALENEGNLPNAFIFISTVSVYGVEEGDMIPESHQLGGTSPYAQSKIQAEHFLQAWAGKNKVPLSVLRLPLVAGAHPPGNLGAMIAAIQNGRYFNIGEGNARKSIVLAKDVAEWIPTIARHPGTYNLTDGYHPGFSELAALIARQAGKAKPASIPHWLALPAAFAGNFLGANAPLNCDRLRKITATLTFDDTKARQQFGWNPRKVLDAFTIN